MPKTTESDKLIPKLYRRKYQDLGLLFFVEGQKAIIPAIPTVKAIENYYRYIGESDYDIQCTLVLLTRLKHEYFESEKTV